MKTLICLLVCIPLVSVMVDAQSTACLQDQYGNQYNFTIDTVHNYLYGTATPSSTQCPSPPWALTGSYVQTGAGLALELTAAMPSGASCVPIYTLKGDFPNFDWYYDYGISTTPQQSKFVACGTAVSPKVTGKGNQK